MKSLKREIRLWLFTVLIGWAMDILPKDGNLEIKKWLIHLPINTLK